MNSYGIRVEPLGTHPDTGYAMYVLQRRRGAETQEDRVTEMQSSRGAETQSSSGAEWTNTGGQCHRDTDSQACEGGCERRLAVELPYCRCCGGRDVLSEPLGRGFQNLCYECGQRIQNLRNAKSRLKVAYTNQRKLLTPYNNIVDKLRWYEDKAAHGYWVPERLIADSQQLCAQVKPIVDKQLRLEEEAKSSEYKETESAKSASFCSFCNMRRPVKPYDKSRVICRECNDRKSSYEYFKLHLGCLDAKALQDFNSLLDVYVDIRDNAGGWAPDISGMRRRIVEAQRRLSNAETDENEDEL